TQFRHFFEWKMRNPVDQLKALADRSDWFKTNLRLRLIKPGGHIMDGLNGIDTKEVFTLLVKLDKGANFYVDAPGEAYGFEYWTADLLKVSVKLIDLVSKNREDLRSHNAAVASYNIQKAKDEQLIGQAFARNPVDEESGPMAYLRHKLDKQTKQKYG
ncbi:MAG: hypothetical protein INR73_29295, partial [Williamsia sp.]|nr:hypothetical protein [Williamsia sp.]